MNLVLMALEFGVLQINSFAIQYEPIQHTILTIGQSKNGVHQHRSMLWKPIKGNQWCKGYNRKVKTLGSPMCEGFLT